MLGLSGLGSALVLSPFLLPDATALTAPSANQRRHLQNMARMAMTSPAGETHHMRPSTPPKSGPAEPAANFDSLNVALKHHVPLSTCCSGVYGSDIWGYTSAATGKEWALMCYRTGLSAVDVQTAAVVTAPSFTSPSSVWKDVKVFGHHAYYVTEALDQPGIVVFDLSGLDSDPPSISVGPAAIDNGGGPESSHNVVVDEVSGYLYRVGGWNDNKNVRMYDLNANPAAPQYIGKFGEGYVHDGQVTTFASGPYAGKQIFFAARALGWGWGARLQIWDVTDKSAIALLGNGTWPGAVYSHNVWVDIGTMRAYVGDELFSYSSGAPTTIFEFNVSDLSSPSFLTSFTNGVGAISHNHICRNGRLYVANYASGMRVFDLSSRSEMGYFDTYPDGDGTKNWNGAWGTYVFPASGLVVVSDQNRGLFVLEDLGSSAPSHPPPPSPPTSPPPPSPPTGCACAVSHPYCWGIHSGEQASGDLYCYESASSSSWHATICPGTCTSDYVSDAMPPPPSASPSPPPPSASPSPPPMPNTGGGGSSAGVVIGAIVGSVSLTILFTLLVLLKYNLLRCHMRTAEPNIVSRSAGPDSIRADMLRRAKDEKKDNAHLHGVEIPEC